MYVCTRWRLEVNLWGVVPPCSSFLGCCQNLICKGVSLPFQLNQTEPKANGYEVSKSWGSTLLVACNRWYSKSVFLIMLFFYYEFQHHSEASSDCSLPRLPVHCMKSPPHGSCRRAEHKEQSQTSHPSSPHYISCMCVKFRPSRL